MTPSRHMAMAAKCGHDYVIYSGKDGSKLSHTGATKHGDLMTHLDYLKTKPNVIMERDSDGLVSTIDLDSRLRVEYRPVVRPSACNGDVRWNGRRFGR